MVGKHIFVRCRNEQNNAGTWTAAITEGVVDKDIVRNFIEPRCNMDETFAQHSLMSCPSNNVLRIYYANNNTLVVTRTYWVTDKITETQGRKGAYSVSYILTGEDIAKFCTDYSGAFDVSCFESYDTLVARISDNPNNRITLGEKENIFSHSDIENNASILEQCGFNESSFITFMNGLYDAVENKKHLTVILPRTIRTAWVENSDNSVENLIHYLLSLLPDFMRINIGLASHWNCQISDKMVGDMPLIFVHPQNEDDITYLRRDGAHILDLDKEQYTSDIPDIAPNYFSFIWKNRTNISSCEDFWTYCKTNYKRLLRGRPTSANAMECIYLMHSTMSENYSDTPRCKKALLLSAKEFAGAGTRVSLAEEFIFEAINTLKLEQLFVDREIEDALRHLVGADMEKTKHQLQEYKILLNAIEQGNASPETIEILCNEINKEGRNAISYFISYLTDNLNIPQDKITLQMTHFLSKLFVVLSQKEKDSATLELMSLCLKAVKNWSETLHNNKQDWAKYISPFVDAYITYMKSDESNTECVDAVYNFLFYYFYSLDNEIREKCEKALQKEEIRIYKKPNIVIDNGELRLLRYADTFLNSFNLVLNTSKETISLSYERLFRLIFNPIKQISEKSIALYQDITTEMIADKNNFSEKISSFILKCEENALRDKPPIWSPEHTEKCIVLTEHKNVNLFETYYPSEERLTFLIEHFRNDNKAIYPLFAIYAEKMPFDVRQSLYKVLQSKNMLVRFYVHILLYTDKENIKREVESLLGFSHYEMLKNILTLHDLTDKNESVTDKFSAWYTNELDNLLVSVSNNKSQMVFEKQYNFILNELKTIKAFHYDSSDIVNVVYNTFFEYVYNIFNNISKEDIGRLPLDVVKNILTIQNESTVKETLTNMNVFELVQHLDLLISSNDTQKLFAICDKYYDDVSMRNIIKNRLVIKLKANTCGSKLACQIYYVMLESNEGTGYSLENLLKYVEYDSLSHIEKGNILVDIMIQIHDDRANIEKEVGRKVMGYLEAIALENPTALLQPAFTNRWRQIRTFEYTKTSNFLRIMSKAQSNNTVKFDIKMLILCVIGLVITCVIMSLLSFAIIKLATFNAIITILVSTVILLAISLVDVYMFIDMLNSKNRRKSR